MTLQIEQTTRSEPAVVRCAQCGDPLPLARYKDRDPEEHILCAECAVENFPHTD